MYIYCLVIFVVLFFHAYSISEWLLLLSCVVNEFRIKFLLSLYRIV